LEERVQPTTSLPSTTLPTTTSPTLHQPRIDLEVVAEEEEDEYAIENRYYERYEEGGEGEGDGRNVDLNM